MHLQRNALNLFHHLLEDFRNKCFPCQSFGITKKSLMTHNPSVAALNNSNFDQRKKKGGLFIWELFFVASLTSLSIPWYQEEFRTPRTKNETSFFQVFWHSKSCRKSPTLVGLKMDGVTRWTLMAKLPTVSRYLFWLNPSKHFSNLRVAQPSQEIARDY